MKHSLEIMPATAAPHGAVGSKECDPNYKGVLFDLGDRCRIVVCRNGIQWIMQFLVTVSAHPVWRSEYFFRQRSTLVSLCSDLSRTRWPRNCANLHPWASSLIAQMPETIKRPLQPKKKAAAQDKSRTTADLTNRNVTGFVAQTQQKHGEHTDD